MLAAKPDQPVCVFVGLAIPPVRSPAIEELNRNVTSMRTASCRAASQPAAPREGREAAALLERARSVHRSPEGRCRAPELWLHSFTRDRSTATVQTGALHTAQAARPSLISRKPTVKNTTRKLHRSPAGSQKLCGVFYRLEILHIFVYKVDHARCRPIRCKYVFFCSR